jgi:hypothetical protein
MNDAPSAPTNKSIMEGSLAAALGGSAASVIVLGLASFGFQFAPGFESAFGTLLTVLAYIGFKKLRQRR